MSDAAKIVNMVITVLKRSGIKIEKNWSENGALWNFAGKRG